MSCDIELNQILESLNQVQQDISLPKNVRQKLKLICSCLSVKNKELSIRIDETLQEMDEISENPNIPIYAKTQIWSIVSLLEEIRQ